MLQEWLKAIQKHFDERNPVTTVIEGKTYAVKADRTLGDYVRPPAPLYSPTLNISTLSGIVDVYNKHIDSFEDDGVAVQVVSPDVVHIVSMKADDFGHRHVYAAAAAVPVKAITFGEYYEPEPFLIALQSAFVPSENVTALQRLSSTITAKSSISVADDGISQVVTVQEGGVQHGNVEVPSRLPLSPYRTFREITPVESGFMIRMKAVKDQLPRIALLEVDGGKWKVDTIAAVGAWLRAELPGATVIA